MKAGKLAHECDECDKKRFALGLVEMALLRASSELDKWLRRDNALLLGDLGREEEAIQLLVPTCTGLLLLVVFTGTAVVP